MPEAAVACFAFPNEAASLSRTEPSATCTYSFAGKTIAQRTAAAGTVKLAVIISDGVDTTQTILQPATTTTSVTRYTDAYGLNRGATQTATGAYTTAPAATCGISTNGANPAGYSAANGYIGGLADTISTLTHLGARDPDPILNRVKQQDFSAYQYANADPINNSDPSGFAIAGPSEGIPLRPNDVWSNYYASSQPVTWNSSLDGSGGSFTRDVTDYKAYGQGPPNNAISGPAYNGPSKAPYADDMTTGILGIAAGVTCFFTSGIECPAAITSVKLKQENDAQNKANLPPVPWDKHLDQPDQAYYDSWKNIKEQFWTNGHIPPEVFRVLHRVDEKDSVFPGYSGKKTI
ncbi:hypothetical protein QO003_000894 [Arthrobacter silviterrae]|nr:hypothetical protein [Arthrobacter silviterrae]